MEMEMPTPCERCDDVFDLHDGRPSPRNPRIVICENCAEKEQEEAECEAEIEALQQEISEAEWTIDHARRRLRELGAETVIR